MESPCAIVTFLVKAQIPVGNERCRLSKAKGCDTFGGGQTFVPVYVECLCNKSNIPKVQHDVQSGFAVEE